MISFKPAQVLAPLLDSLGITITWKLLLLTLVNDTRPTLGDYLSRQDEFRDVVSLNTTVPNLLTELSIGEIGVLYEYSLAYVNHKSRKSNGQFFTPDDVAQLMADFASELDPQGVWLDPCCGVGNLSYWLVVSKENPEQFLINNMRFNDLDSLALLICRTLMTFWFQESCDDLFVKLRDNYTNLDFLTPDFTDQVSYTNILLNPPYANAEKKQGYLTASIHDLWAYFLEQSINTAKGFVSVTPQTFTNARKYEPLRKLLLSTAQQLNIYCFDNIPDAVFHGYKFGSQNTNTSNSVRAAITVWRKPDLNLPNKAPEHSITPLLRWPVSMRHDIFKHIRSFANYSTSGVFTLKSFPKNWRETTKLYKDLLPEPQLNTLLSKTITPYVLYVPSTPRYFISATRRHLQRSSYHTLYFTDELARDKAYVLLNSSLMYWWWRLMDGGMTLSTSTLESLPLPKELSKLQPTQLERSVQLLVESERTNLVVKANAGKQNQNVKHSTELVHALTSQVVSDKKISDFLSKIHTNNDLSYKRLIS